MKKLIMTAMAAVLAVPALAAGDAAWDGAMRKTAWEIANHDPGAAIPTPAAKPAADLFNRHFACFATQFYGALQLEVEQLPPPHRAYPVPNEPGRVRVTLQGIRASQAAQSLGIASGADSLVVEFPDNWCQISAATPGVFSCELPDWQWPRPTLNAQAFDGSGRLVGSGTLAVVRIGAEKTLRTSAGAGADVQRQFLELEVSAISETDNAARAELRLPYQPRDCRPK